MFWLQKALMLMLMMLNINFNDAFWLRFKEKSHYKLCQFILSFITWIYIAPL